MTPFEYPVRPWVWMDFIPDCDCEWRKWYDAEAHRLALPEAEGGPRDPFAEPSPDVPAVLENYTPGSPYKPCGFCRAHIADRENQVERYHARKKEVLPPILQKAMDDTYLYKIGLKDGTILVFGWGFMNFDGTFWSCRDVETNQSFGPMLTAFENDVQDRGVDVAVSQIAWALDSAS